MIHKLKLVWLFLLVLSNIKGYSQFNENKLGPYSKNNRFKLDKKETKLYRQHRFTPKRNSVIAYDKKGKAIKMQPIDTLRAAELYQGSWAGKSGTWVLFYGNTQMRSAIPMDDLYVLKSDLTDIETEAKLQDKVRFEKKNQAFQDRIIKRVLPGILVLIALHLLTRRLRQEYTGMLYLLGKWFIGFGIICFIAFIIPIFPAIGFFAIPLGTLLVWLSYIKFWQKLLWSIPFIIYMYFTLELVERFIL